MFGPAKEVMVLSALVCLSVRLFVCGLDNAKGTARMWLKFSNNIGIRADNYILKVI